jgi:uridine kinase
VSAVHVIAIDGIDGSGKSYLARRVCAACEALGQPARLIHVDDFRRPLDWETVADEAAAYWEQYYDFAALTAAVAGANSGLLVIEGVFPLRVPAIADGTLIYLDTSPGEARRRIIARDMPKGRTRQEVERRIDRRYAPCQQRYHREFGPRERAHLVLDNEDPAAPRLVIARLDGRPELVRRALAAVIPPT